MSKKANVYTLAEYVEKYHKSYRDFCLTHGYPEGTVHGWKESSNAIVIQYSDSTIKVAPKAV